MTRTSTVREVRKFYKEQGCKVRISNDGHVTFKAQPDGPWLEGRWVEEYRTTFYGPNDFTVRLT